MQDSFVWKAPEDGITSSPYSLPAFASPSMSFHNKTARSDMGSVIVVTNMRTNEKVGDQLNGSTGTRLSSGSYQFKYGHGPVWTHGDWIGKFANIYFGCLDTYNLIFGDRVT